MRFVGVYSLFLFDAELAEVPTPSESAQDAWVKSKGIYIVFYQRFFGLGNTDEGRIKAHECLHKYGG